MTRTRPAGSDPSISVIVSAYGRPEFMELVLRGFARQTDRRFELLVADDGSGPEVQAAAERVARETGMEVTHLWHADEGFRKTVILNRAVLAARGDYLLFTDGDCIPRADLVAVHRRQLRVLLPHFLIDTDVLPGRNAPGKIFAHAVAHQPLP